MAIEAVIFAIGGVLLRSTDARAHRYWEARLGLRPGELYRRPVLSEVADLATVGKVPEMAVWATLARQFGLTTEQARALERDCYSANRLDRAFLHFLRSLRPGYETALLSNAWSGAREVHTLTSGLTESVDLLILSCEVGVAKPDVRIFELTLEQLGV
jgi:putative hydrolase of the HAD superfamily